MSGAENVERMVCVAGDNTLSEIAPDMRPNNIAGADGHNTAQVG